MLQRLISDRKKRKRKERFYFRRQMIWFINKSTNMRFWVPRVLLIAIKILFQKWNSTVKVLAYCLWLSTDWDVCWNHGHAVVSSTVTFITRMRLLKFLTDYCSFISLKTISVWLNFFALHCKITFELLQKLKQSNSTAKNICTLYLKSPHITRCLSLWTVIIWSITFIFETT